MCSYPFNTKIYLPCYGSKCFAKDPLVFLLEHAYLCSMDYCYPHFTAEKIKAAHQVLYPKSHSNKVAKPGFELRLFTSVALALKHALC